MFSFLYCLGSFFNRHIFNLMTRWIIVFLNAGENLSKSFEKFWTYSTQLQSFNFSVNVFTCPPFFSLVGALTLFQSPNTAKLSMHSSQYCSSTDLDVVSEIKPMRFPEYPLILGLAETYRWCLQGDTFIIPHMGL